MRIDTGSRGVRGLWIMAVRAMLMRVVRVAVLDGLRRRPVAMKVIVAAAFEKYGAPGERESGQERNGKGGAIVPVKLQFRQQITRGDADESSSSETERLAETELRFRSYRR